MPFVIKTPKGYVKRTSNFGAFHGNIVLTDAIEEAFRFTRKHDAERRGDVLVHRTRPVVHPDPGAERQWWHGYEGRDHKKFGALTYEVLEA